MFNNFNVRPIGSDKFLEHLKDAQAKSFYNTSLPCEETIDTDFHGCAPWVNNKSNIEDDNYASLVIAIIANAMMEYLYYYYYRTLEEYNKGRTGHYWFLNSRCIELENSYFRRNPFLEELFDALLKNVCWEGTAEMEQCMKRLRGLLRWSHKDK